MLPRQLFPTDYEHLLNSNPVNMLYPIGIAMDVIKTIRGIFAKPCARRRPELTRRG
jgi:hypothetical protein